MPAPRVAALTGASSKVKLTIGRSLCSPAGVARRYRASLLPLRAFRVGHNERMISVLSSTNAGRQLDAGGQIFEPVAENRRGRNPGGEIGAKPEARKVDADRNLPLGARPLLVMAELVFGFGVEIA